MSATDHLANAREHIANGENSYRLAVQDILAERAENGTTWVAIADALGRSESWVHTLVREYKKLPDPTADLQGFSPFGGEEENEARYQRQTNTALKDPERRQQAIAALPTEQVEQVIQEAHEVVRDRMRARRDEHDTTPQPPTVRDLMGDERFDPSESWADGDIIRVQGKAHILHHHVQKWGLVLGALSEEEAFGMLQEAERNIAEVRVVLQERMADRSRTEA